MRSLLAVLHVLGALLLMFSVLFLLPIGAALIWREHEALETVVHGPADRSRVIGRTVEEIPMPEGATISVVVRGSKVLIAHHDTRIEEEDHVIVFLSDRRHVEQVERLFSGPVGR